MNIQQLFRHSRLRLALSYAGIMAIILSLSGFLVYRFLIQSHWYAMESELESIAGTLHDSLEPMLPSSGSPTAVLQRILPELCLVNRPCQFNPTFIERHTTGISDRTNYYIRLFDYQKQLLAFTPSQPAGISAVFPSEPWLTFVSAEGIRYRQFTIMLHSHSHPDIGEHKHDSWGYLQIGRSLTNFDRTVKNLKWIFIIGFALALVLVIFSSWWLSALAMQPIYRSYQQQQKFTANAAHELRTPLASLLATVEAILRTPIAQWQDLTFMLEMLERQGRRLSYLITDLLFLSNLEQDSFNTTDQLCCLNDLVSDLTEEFLELATLGNIQLSWNICPEEIYVLGNEAQLYRLVSNLISNALNYTTDGGEVLVSLTKKDNIAIIQVKDTGIGIAPAEQDKIWQRFYRIPVDSEFTRKPTGTGLGLSIVQVIAHRHHAHLKVESTLGIGSIFTFEIPVQMLNT